MKVQLILKSTEEQHKFMEFSRIDYAKDMAKTDNVSIEEAQKKADRQTKNALENKETETFQ